MTQCMHDFTILATSNYGDSGTIAFICIKCKILSNGSVELNTSESAIALHNLKTKKDSVELEINSRINVWPLIDYEA